MRKKIDYNQYMLAKRVADIILSMSESYTSPLVSVEILPSDDCTQLNVFMHPSDLAAGEFYVSLVMSDEINKGECIGDETRSKRFNQLCEEFDNDPESHWIKAINEYGKKFYLKFDDTFEENIDYMFSVYGEVPDGFDPYENELMKK